MKELKGCTFFPNNALQKNKLEKFDPDAFYKSNIEWQKKREASKEARQNEILKQMRATDADTSRQYSQRQSQLNQSMDTPKDRERDVTANFSNNKANRSGGQHNHISDRSDSRGRQMSRVGSDTQLKSDSKSRAGSQRRPDRSASSRSAQRKRSRSNSFDQKREDVFTRLSSPHTTDRR